MSSPLVTVIIPAYNAAGTIAAALDSVANQDGTADGPSFAPRATEDRRGWTQTGSLEVIVVDDCSTDGTAERVDSFIRQLDDSEEREREAGSAVPKVPASPNPRIIKSSNIRLIRLPHNGGPAAARNAGIREAKGEWIAFLDADDTWMANHVSLHLRVLDLNPDAIMSCGAVMIEGVYGRDAAPEYRPGMTRVVSALDFAFANTVATSSVVVRKSAVLAAGGFDEQFRGPEDVDLWMRLAAAGKVLKTEIPTARYRERAGSLSMNPDTFLPQILRVYGKAFSPAGALYEHRNLRRKAVSSRQCSAAWTYNECGQRGKALAALARSCATYPGSVMVNDRKRPFWRLKLLARILRGSRIVGLRWNLAER